METLYFTLGVLSAVIIFAVLGMFIIRKEMTSKIHREIGDVEARIQTDLSDLRRHVDQLDDSHFKQIDNLDKRIDSRFDKTTNKIAEQIANLYREIEDLKSK